MPKAVEFKINDDVLDKLIKASAIDVNARHIHDQVEYGIFVELGTKHMPARPALIPSFEMATKDFPKVMGIAIEKIVNLDDVMEKIARDVESGWKQLVPTKTSAYKNSIRVTED